MATKKTSHPSKKTATRRQPTLHGLLIARSLSGTVVRTLLFVLLTGALIVAGSSVGSTSSVGPTLSGGLGVLALVAGAYLLFDFLYVLMANIRPLHPRLDRVVLPAALVFALVVIYAPLLIAQQTSLLTGLWLTGGAGLLVVLGTRFGLLIASTK